jgi:hypothetical protein
MAYVVSTMQNAMQWLGFDRRADIDKIWEWLGVGDGVGRGRRRVGVTSWSRVG